MTKIITEKFNDGTPNILKNKKEIENWPVVYILNNEREAYIGETTKVSVRANQHLANEVRRNLKNINIITDETFNKSAILDLESFLIKYMSADNLFELQNGNRGVQEHDYYDRKKYENMFKKIWIELKNKKLVKNDLRVINNSDLFKYSPYKALNEDQYMSVNLILSDLANAVNKKQKETFVVEGGSGTGKTILGIYMFKLLMETKDSKQVEIEEDQVEENLSNILKVNDAIDDLKIALVVPMSNLRKTLKRVFRETKGLKSNMVLSPNDVAKSDEIYDLLIVDEAHRLRRRKNLTQYKSFDDNNKRLNLGEDGTELDWILLKSKYQIFFYDESQSIKPTDVRREDFEKLIYGNKNTHVYPLEKQMRCAGGNEYVKYVKSIFSNTPPTKKEKFSGYDLKLFDDVNEMIDAIKEKDKEVGLCRNVAGFSFEWKSKKKNLPKKLKNATSQEIIAAGYYDFDFNGKKYIWNSNDTDWINSDDSINEIGCIHTTQGFDLNYTGIIIGEELIYNKNENILDINKSKYYDAKGKASTTKEELLRYILNIYQTMMLRGILGTYIYVCDDDLRDYLKKYI